MNCQLFLVLSILSASQAEAFNWGGWGGTADDDVIQEATTNLTHLVRVLDAHRPSTTTIVWESSPESASTSAPSSTPSVTVAPVTGTNATEFVASTTPFFGDKKDMDMKGVKGSDEPFTVVSTSTTALPQVTSTSTMAATEATTTEAATTEAATTVAKTESVDSDSWEDLSDNEIEAEEDKFFHSISEESHTPSKILIALTSTTTSMSTSTESTTSALSEAEAEVTTSPVSTTSEAFTSTTTSTTTSRPTTASTIPKSNVRDEVRVIPVTPAPKSSSATSVSFVVSLGLFLAATSALL